MNEGLNYLQTLGKLLRLQLRGRFGNLNTKISSDLLKVKRDQHVTDRFRTDACRKAVITILILCVKELFFREKLSFLQRRQARLDNNIVFEIKNALKILKRHIHQKADARWQRLQEPDMGNRRSKFDMAHTLTANLRQRYFHTAFFADNTFVLHALIFAAQALIVLHRTKNTRTEQPVTLWLERTVVDRLGLFNFTKRPGKNSLRARK